MILTPRFTSTDLDALPDIEGIRYEIIDGELFVSKSPGWEHQHACGSIFMALQTWSNESGLGTAISALGVIFAADEDVIPDVLWISRERLASGLDAARHLTVAPDLVVEVLSPGAANERRDRQVKLDLYSRQGVLEYWIVDWQQRRVEVYRREAASLRAVVTLAGGDTLTSPLLPGFACPVSEIWPPSF